MRRYLRAWIFTPVFGVAGLRAEPGPVPSWDSQSNGRILDAGTGVGLSSPWTVPMDVRERCVPGRWQTRADVRGWADKDITEDINEAMGVRSDRVPDIATIGSGIADQMRQSGDSATELSGPIDMDSAHLEALVQLGDGVIDGGIMRADLASAEQAGDNRLDISAGMPASRLPSTAFSPIRRPTRITECPRRLAARASGVDLSSTPSSGPSKSTSSAAKTCAVAVSSGRSDLEVDGTDPPPTQCMK